MGPRLFALALLLAPMAHAGNVRIVGGSAATDPTIQSAINASVDGDIVLVRDSNSLGFLVDGKALTIVGELASLSVQSPIVIQNLSASQTCVVRNLTVALPAETLLHVDNCAGHVRIEELHLIGAGSQMSGVSTVLVEDSTDVAIVRSTIGGHQGESLTTAGSGLTVRNATVGLDESLIVGGRGTSFFIPPNFVLGGPGAAAIRLEVGAILALQTTGVTGGDRGNGLCALSNPNTPGPGILATVPTVVSTIDSAVSAGSPSSGGSSACGSAPALVNTTLQSPPVTACRLAVDAVVREQGVLAVRVTGMPGETATLVVSASAQRSVVPGVFGPVLVGPNVRRLALGIIPGSGVLTSALPFGDLPAGTQGLRRHFQVFCRTASNLVHMSGPSSTVWIDSSF